MSGREEAQGREAGHARPEPHQLIVRDVQLHQPVGSQALSQHDLETFRFSWHESHFRSKKNLVI